MSFYLDTNKDLYFEKSNVISFQEPSIISKYEMYQNYFNKSRKRFT